MGDGMMGSLRSQYTIYDANTLELKSHYDTRLYAKARIYVVLFFVWRFWPNILILQVPGSRSKTFFRPDLHDELKRLALFPPVGYKAPTILLGAKVVDVDIDTGTVKLANGSTLSGDIIIGADGERVSTAS